MHVHADTMMIPSGSCKILCSPGQIVSWEETCRIKHLPTKFYLAVVKGELGGYKVCSCVYNLTYALF